MIPNIFTLGNALCGFGSIICSAYGNITPAAYCIFAGALMDSLDGRIARFTHADSPLGIQLDSLSDAVSFCLAPAFLAYSWQLKQCGTVGFIACGLFLAAGLMRLARFNLTHTQQLTNFHGTPTPIAGCLIAALCLTMPTPIIPHGFLILFLLLMPTLAGLMISPIPFPTGKKISQRMQFFACTFFVVVAILVGLRTTLFLGLIGYFMVAFGEYFRAAHRMRKGMQKTK
jgi:CDP-diacylglycerol---serine O-phosphatidyltransferase